MILSYFFRLYIILTTVLLIYRFEVGVFANESSVSYDYSSKNSDGSNVEVVTSESSDVFGDSDRESSKQPSQEDVETSESSVGGSSNSAPEGESLVLGDSSFVGSITSQSDIDSRKVKPREGEGESIQYGYDNIDDSAEYLLTPHLAKSDDFSSPAIMESFEDKPSISEKERKESEVLLDEPPTEKVDSSSVKTPVTEKIEESKEKTPLVEFPEDIDDYKVAVEPVIHKSEMKEDSKELPGSEVVFEEVSESKLPKFVDVAQNQDENMFAKPNIFESSLSSGISDSIESSVTGDQMTSDLIQINETPEDKQTDVELGETGSSFGSDISNSHDTDTKNSESESYNFIEQTETKPSGSESSFVNPPTDEITLTEDLSVNNPPEKEFLNEGVDLKNTNVNLQFYKSETIEPPTPDSSFIEDKTIGNQRFYSGPYVRTNATAGKVSPRIASVIETLVGQFEKYNLYGSGNKNNMSVSGSNVKNIKNSFEGLAGDNVNNAIQPKNAAEEEYIASLKSQTPNNTFLYKNRYEEMRLTKNTFGKSLLQEELEKMRGTLRETISKQLGSGRVWERPVNTNNDSKILKEVYSHDRPIQNRVGVSDHYIDSDNTNSQISIPTLNITLQDKIIDSNLNTDFYSNKYDYNPHDEPISINKSIQSFKDSNTTERSHIKIQKTDFGTENYIDIKNTELASETSKSEDVDTESEISDLDQVASTPEQTNLNQKITSPKRSDGFSGMPFSYINNIKELQSGWKSGDIHENNYKNNFNNMEVIQKDKSVFGNRRLESVDQEYKSPEANGKEYDVSEGTVSYSKQVELSPQEENEINQCYLKAKKIKSVNFGLDISTDSQSPASETFISEVNKHKSKIKELILFGQEATRVAEKYNRKKSWRKKTRKFKLDFLELSNDFLQHAKAVKSLIYHVSNASSRNMINLINKILQKHKHSKQSLLVQCKILDQAFFSHKNSIRGKLMKRISDMYFVDVINEQIGILINERFNPLVNSIKSNKYTKKKLFKIVPSVDLLIVDKKGYSELPQSDLETKETKRRRNKLLDVLKKIFKRPSFLKAKKKNLKCVKTGNCCKKNKQK
ncbi:hypothetical protein FG386_000152 [Cryptosporidium ryanae]|uniref:uncharacterized protein n=1 Tax=Cryptosporidium ryanae TaxID=515981 RepID=UPI003519EE1D|nr:hypothetical protein FG386_000152 [Cryptosporidium ryanae]